MATSVTRVGMGGDIARFGLAILIASALGAVQVFVIPSRLDIVTFGEYRLFLLYVGYIGVLHFGLADGAFLRWAGRPIDDIRHELKPIARRLFAIDAGLLLVAGAAAFVVQDTLIRIFLLGFAFAALAMNAATLVGYALQAGGDFRGAGRVAVLSPLLFVGAVIALPIRSAVAIIAAYVASFGLAAIGGALRFIDRRGPRIAAEPSLNFRTMFSDGLPVLGANTAAALSQFGDRLLVSFFVPIASFALYGFASSVMVTANAATQTLSRVALSHAARLPSDGEARAVLLGGFYDLIAAGFGVAMAGVPFFEFLVKGHLPAYSNALPIVRALVLGAPFWVGIHVVLVGTMQSYGLVRRQLTLELIGLVLVVIGCGACLLAGTPLWIVASASSAAAVIAWIIGVLVLRTLIVGAESQPVFRFVWIVLTQSAAVLVVLLVHVHWLEQSVAYAMFASVPTYVAARAAKRHGW